MNWLLKDLINSKDRPGGKYEKVRTRCAKLLSLMEVGVVVIAGGFTIISICSSKSSNHDNRPSGNGGRNNVRK